MRELWSFELKLLLFLSGEGTLRIFFQFYLPKVKEEFPGNPYIVVEISSESI
jgi:hypothetical protein